MMTKLERRLRAAGLALEAFNDVDFAVALALAAALPDPDEGDVERELEREVCAAAVVDEEHRRHRDVEALAAARDVVAQARAICAAAAMEDA